MKNELIDTNKRQEEHYIDCLRFFAFAKLNNKIIKKSELSFYKIFSSIFSKDKDHLENIANQIEPPEAKYDLNDNLTRMNLNYYIGHKIKMFAKDKLEFANIDKDMSLVKNSLDILTPDSLNHLILSWEGANSWDDWKIDTLLPSLKNIWESKKLNEITLDVIEWGEGRFDQIMKSVSKWKILNLIGIGVISQKQKRVDLDTKFRTHTIRIQAMVEEDDLSNIFTLLEYVSKTSLKESLRKIKAPKITLDEDLQEIISECKKLELSKISFKEL